jgi:hypothetical protein
MGPMSLRRHVETTREQDNALDVVEHLVSENEWPFERQGEDELVCGVAGHWAEYQMWFSRRAEGGALQLSCAFDLRAPSARRGDLHSLIIMINEKLWLGHFDMWEDDGLIVYRHTMLLPEAQPPVMRLVEQVVETALSECERFYPAFQFAIWGGKGPKEAIAAAMIETMGEA